MQQHVVHVLASNRQLTRHGVGCARCRYLEAELPDSQYVRSGRYIVWYLRHSQVRMCWRRYDGKLFVFDGRRMVAPQELSGDSQGAGDSGSGSEAVVGRCLYCEAPYDTLLDDV